VRREARPAGIAYVEREAIKAGFMGEDALWIRAGHALFGGYEPR